MEGRPARLHPETGEYRARVDQLVRADRAAQFRDATIGQAQAILVAVTITLAVAAGLWFRFARRTAVTMLLAWASLGADRVRDRHVPRRPVPVLPVGLDRVPRLHGRASRSSFAGLCLALGRRGPVDPVLIALGIVVAMHLVDLLSGARLQFNTVFGYSPTVGIRLAGIGNPGSAQLSIAALLFAILISWRLPRRGAGIGYAVLGGTLVVVGAPMWGQDYGGALALAPTLVLWWLLLTHRRVRWRTVFTILGVIVATGLVAGFVDLSRPANERTHVGRFFEKIGEDGPAGFFTVIGRKLGLMIGTFSNTAWVLLVLSVLVLVALAFRKTDVMTRLFARVPTLRPGLVCVAVLVVLATVLNDSGVQVTGMMAAMVLPTLLFLATRFVDTDDAPEPVGEPPPADRVPVRAARCRRGR